MNWYRWKIRSFDHLKYFLSRISSYPCTHSIYFWASPFCALILTPMVASTWMQNDNNKKTSYQNFSNNKRIQNSTNKGLPQIISNVQLYKYGYKLNSPTSTWDSTFWTKIEAFLLKTSKNFSRIEKWNAGVRIFLHTDHFSPVISIITYSALLSTLRYLFNKAKA